MNSIASADLLHFHSWNWGIYAILIFLPLQFLLRSLIWKKIIQKKKEVSFSAGYRIAHSIDKPLTALIFVLTVSTAIFFYFPLDAKKVIVSNLIFISLSVNITWFAASFITALLDTLILKHQDGIKLPKIITGVLNAAIYLMGLIFVLSYFNIQLSPLLATLGLGSLAIGLALQNTFSNVFAGFQLLTDKPVKLGDFIELENGFSGYVEDIGWRSTRIQMLQGTRVIIPNSKIADGLLFNHSLSHDGIAVLINCGVAYESDLNKVETTVDATAKIIQEKYSAGLHEFVPFIRFNHFGDSNIEFTVIMRGATYPERYIMTHEFIKLLVLNFAAASIEISWPVRKIINTPVQK